MTPTGTEARVCQDIAERQQRGIEKYGTTVEANPLPPSVWATHLYQELTDGAVYVRRLIDQMLAVELAVRDYHLALDNRENGYSACMKAMRKIEEAMNKTWVQGEEKAKFDGACEEVYRYAPKPLQVPPPMEKPTEHQYRPFANFIELREWIKQDSGDDGNLWLEHKSGGRFATITSIGTWKNETGSGCYVVIDGNRFNMEQLLDCWKGFTTGQPCGVRL